MIYHFYQKEWKLKNVINLHAILIRALKEALSHGLILKLFNLIQVIQVTQFNQEIIVKIIY